MFAGPFDECYALIDNEMMKVYEGVRIRDIM